MPGIVPAAPPVDAVLDIVQDLKHIFHRSLLLVPSLAQPPPFCHIPPFKGGQCLGGCFGIGSGQFAAAFLAREEIEDR